MNFIKRHKKSIVILVAILLVLGFLFRPKPPKPIATEAVKQGSITQSLSVTGVIYSQTSVDLSFLAGGKLLYLGVKKGDFVKQYQVIANLDQRTLQKNLENALIDYSKQRNVFDQTKENNGNRIPSEALTSAMRRILENNQYDLNKAVNSVELESLAKEQSTLISPIDGIVTRLDPQAAGINIYSTAVFTVADPYNLIFKVDIDEADIGRVKLNQTMEILLDAYPDRLITIPISSIDFASHTTSTGGNAYTAETKLPSNKELLYRIGMNGDAKIILKEKDKVLTIPLSSIFDDTFVFVKEGNKFTKRRVKIGIESDTRVEIKSGLNINEQVVVQPSEVLKK